MNQIRSPRHTQAILMLLLANFLWGISFPTIKALGMIQEQLTPGVSSWFITSMTVAPRFLLAALVLLVLQAKRLGDTTRSELKQGMMLGLFATGGMLFQNDGLQFTQASTSAFLTQLYAIMIPVWVALHKRRNPGGRVWICCSLVLAGVAILGRFDWKTLSLGRGELETLVSSVFFMGQILSLELPEFSRNRAERITLIMVIFEMLMFWMLAGLTAPSLSMLLVPWSSLPWLGLTLVLTLFCTLGGLGIMNAWQPKISSTEAGLIYCFEPIFGTLLSLCLPALYSAWSGIGYGNESATWHLLLGGGLITLANLMLQWPRHAGS